MINKVQDLNLDKYLGFWVDSIEYSIKEESLLIILRQDLKSHPHVAMKLVDCPFFIDQGLTGNKISDINVLDFPGIYFFSLLEQEGRIGDQYLELRISTDSKNPFFNPRHEYFGARMTCKEIQILSDWEDFNRI